MLDDPRSIGEALKALQYWAISGIIVWVNYRVIVSIADDALQVLVVKIGNRREVNLKVMILCFIRITCK